MVVVVVVVSHSLVGVVAVFEAVAVELGSFAFEEVAVDLWSNRVFEADFEDMKRDFDYSWDVTLLGKIEVVDQLPVFLPPSYGVGGFGMFQMLRLRTFHLMMWTMHTTVRLTRVRSLMINREMHYSMKDIILIIHLTSPRL